ncbi:MAG: amidohydrolase family protein [Gammaproteobacteria bacterium]|nr:amidohydrolase family protein [Gammaproteobacteria bacterium]
MVSTLFTNATLFDGEADGLRQGYHVLVEGMEIREVSDRPLRSVSAETIDVKGQTLMPGLIDAHVHVTDHDVSPARLQELPPSWVALKAAKLMREMLFRGFTSIRDAAGADSGLARAVEEELITGPRLFHCGRGLSQTGGHGDFREPGNDVDPCCYGRTGMTIIADGVSAVRKAAREELRKGAHAIKIMASGGVTSPSDPLLGLQYSEDEIRAAVEEAEHRETYVLAHTYSDEAINRALKCGVRSIEHANFIELDTAELAERSGAFVIPTLVTYQAMMDRGEEIGLPAYSTKKVSEVHKAGLKSLEYLKQAGTSTGFGTDLFGPLHDMQSDEFQIRAEVLTPFEILQSATKINAQLLNMYPKLGCIRPGALADLLIIDGNPLRDISLLQLPERTITHIMKSGRFYKRPD